MTQILAHIRTSFATRIGLAFKKNNAHVDWWLLLPAVGLMLFSVAFVYSASAYFASVKFGSSEKLFWNHGIRVIASIMLVIIFARLDYHVVQKISKYLLLLAIGFLIFVLIAGTRIKGATRWVNIGFINFQPSELAKYALVLHIATLLALKKAYLHDFKTGFAPVFLWICIVCGLIALQPNFSTAAVIFTIASCVLILGNVKLRHIAVVIPLGIVGGAAYAVSAPYRMKRLLAFKDQFLGTAQTSDGITSISEANYQLHQGILAFANGGMFGVGPGNSIQRNWFLPESYGDFIFSIIGEEYGFMGAGCIILAFMLIIWRGFVTARRAPDDFGRYLAAGITIIIGLYAFLHMGINTGLLPTTGLPLPFISYGGTAILFTAGALGILLNISAQAGVYPRDKTTFEREGIVLPKS